MKMACGGYFGSQLNSSEFIGLGKHLISLFSFVFGVKYNKRMDCYYLPFGCAWGILMVAVNTLLLSVGQKCISEVITSHALILFFRKEFHGCVVTICTVVVVGGVCVFEVHRNENSN